MKWILFLAAVFFIVCGSATEKTVKQVQTDKKKDTSSLLNKGLESYKSRRYNEARSLLKEALGDKIDKHQRFMALKYLAFIDALEKNISSAKKHFLEFFKTDNNFELDKAEYGNPVWTPIFEEARNEFLRGHFTGEDWFKEGQQHYRDRQYTEALSAFDSALVKKKLSKDYRLLILKHQGFIYSNQKQTQKAKAVFCQSFDMNKKFELEPSEYGNPLWTPIYEEIKKEFVK